MRCAFERFPSHIIELINFCTKSLPNTESAGTSRRTTNPLRGIRSLYSGGPQERPALVIQRAQTRARIISRRAQSRARARSLLLCGLRSLGAILRAPLLAVFNASCVECSANHVITHTGKILYAAPTHEHDGVLLQVMSNTRNVRCNFDTVC